MVSALIFRVVAHICLSLPECHVRILPELRNVGSRVRTVFSQKPSKQIFCISNNIIDIGLYGTLILAFYCLSRMSQESSPPLQLLQMKSTYSKTLLSLPIRYYHLAVPLHIQLGEKLLRCVSSALAAVCTPHWGWAGRHELHEHLELNVSATRHLYQKILEQTQ